MASRYLIAPRVRINGKDIAAAGVSLVKNFDGKPRITIMCLPVSLEVGQAVLLEFEAGTGSFLGAACLSDRCRYPESETLLFEPCDDSLLSLPEAPDIDWRPDSTIPEDHYAA